MFLILQILWKIVRLLDLILTNDSISQITAGILYSDVSDHFPTFVLIKNVEKRKSPCFRKQVLQIQNEFQH